MGLRKIGYGLFLIFTLDYGLLKHPPPPSQQVYINIDIFIVSGQYSGQSCPRTNIDRDSNCAKECSLSIGCISDKRKCICDGDCGYSCVKKGIFAWRCLQEHNWSAN